MRGSGRKFSFDISDLLTATMLSIHRWWNQCEYSRQSSQAPRVNKGTKNTRKEEQASPETDITIRSFGQVDRITFLDAHFLPNLLGYDQSKRVIDLA